MRVVFANPKTAEVLLEITAGDTLPIPGDIVVMPDTKIYTVVQRAFVVEEVNVTSVVEIGRGVALDLTVQIAIIPLEIEVGEVQ